MEQVRPTIAYFSMEFGLHTDFRIYAGALGIAAGDFLKSAKDKGYPVIGVGILWKEGYVEQHLDKDNNVIDCFYNNEYNFLQDTGIKVSVKIKNKDIYCKVWKVDCFNNSELYLLDTFLPENEEKWITAQLYGWFEEEKIAQAMVLGIGGVKALRQLNKNIDFYHLNEGNTAFAALELIREKMLEGLNMKDAWASVKNQVVFTMHTSMDQYNEYYDFNTLEYMGAFNGLDTDILREIGGEPFNMTVAALTVSKIANSISESHCKEVNKNWEGINNKCEIINITNGIHIPTWSDSSIESAYRENGDLWEPHIKNKQNLIDYIYNTKKIQLDKDKLLIGFAKSAASYKKGKLIFYFEEKVEKYLKEGTIQIVISSKAHPLDFLGKEVLKYFSNLEIKYPNSVVFIENYNMEIGSILTKGADIWLNNPKVTKEACGASGMKAAINGVINVSTLDGWWPEVCWDGVNGWQIGDDFNSSDLDEVDRYIAESLFQTLVNKIVNIYYNNRNRWIEMMYLSIRATIDKYSSARMIDEYYQKLYKKE